MRIVGALVTAVAAAIAAIGIAIFTVFGTDGVLSSGGQMVASTTPALVSSAAKVRGIAGGARILGAPSVRIDLAGDRFIGVGHSADVERYLAGVPHEEVTDITSDPFAFERHKVTGTRAAAPPAAQAFWIARGSSALRWRVRDGDYRIVVMSRDGSTPLLTTGRFGVRIPRLPAIGAALALFGLLGLAAGTGLLLASRTRGRNQGGASGCAPDAPRGPGVEARGQQS